MSVDVAIVGGGLSGMAAGLTAGAFGLRASLVRGGPGATAFASGAFDLSPWWEAESAARLLGAPRLATSTSSDTNRILDALGIVAKTAAGAALPVLATVNGSTRATDHRDRSLADLRAWSGRTVIVPRADRAAWDADAIARGLTQSAPPELGLRFEAADAQILFYADEDRAADAELAARHDDPVRLDWLAQRLKAIAGRFERPAILLGPWLGLTAPRADALAERLGFPVGEALSGTGGTAGSRLEAAVARALAASGVDVLSGRVTRIARDGRSSRLTLDDGRSVVATNVVLATGSFLGGGFVHLPSEHGAPSDGPTQVRPPFASAIAGAPMVTSRGRRGVGASLLGPTLDATAWPESSGVGDLERVGFDHHEGRLEEGWLASGDALAEAPRTALHAIESGVRAARACAKD